MNEVSADFAEAWRRFQALGAVRMLDETIEGEWQRGRTDYIAFLVPITDEAVRAHISRTLEAIADVPGVEPYPERYWHVTVKGVGFMVDEPRREDELSPADVQRLADEARPLLEAERAFEAGVGPVSGFPEVVFLEVADRGAVRRLNSLLLERLPGLQRTPVDGEAFLPHISIARFSSPEGLPLLKDRLERLRSECGEGPRFGVDQVLLIQAHLAAEAPVFDLLAAYGLSSQ